MVLAAGMSRRMGAHKMLLPWGGGKVIAHIVDELLGSRADRVLVVVGFEGEKVTGQLLGRDVTIVSNADYAEGMLSSVRCGLRALPGGCEKVLVVLGDQPSLTAELVNEMLQAETKKGIVVPKYNGKRGHPLLFAIDYREEILTHFNEEGLRGLLRAHPEEVFELNVLNSTVLSDMDCPEDYRREQERINRNHLA